MKKIIPAIILALYTFSSCTFGSIALAENNKEKAAITNSNEETKKDAYSPHSKYMLTADLGSDLVLYEKNCEAEIAPSGFAKILTAITALELCDDITKNVTIKDGILENYNYNNRNIGLKYGEKISIEDMLKAMLVYDAGDCAIAIAHSVGKSYESFVDKMNEISKNAGAANSSFVHPAGFEAKGQKTTLMDMYYITKYALKNKTFAKFVSLDRIEIKPTNKYNESRILFNTNQFITTYYSLDHYNANVYGVKSYYNDAENCGVIAKYNDSQNNLLVLCAGADTKDGNSFAYNDAKHMITFAKENFIQVNVVNKEEFMAEVEIPNGKNAERLLLVSEDRIKTMLPVSYDSKLLEIKTETKDKIYAPVEKGDVLGKTIVYYDGKKCGEVNLLAYSKVEKSTLVFIRKKLSAVFTSVYFKLIIGIFIVAFVYKLLGNRKKVKKKK